MIPESIHIGSLLEYFELIRDGGFEDGSEGLLEKLKRKIENNYSRTTKKEAEKVIELLKKENQEHLWREWLTFDISLQHPKALEFSIENSKEQYLHFLAEHILSKTRWMKYPQLVEQFIKSKRADKKALRKLATYTLSQPGWSKYPHLLEQFIIKRASQNTLRASSAKRIFLQSGWSKAPHLLEKVINLGDQSILRDLGTLLFPLPRWSQYPRLIDQMLKKADRGVLKSFVAFSLNQSRWQDHPGYIERILEITDNKDVLEFIRMAVLSAEEFSRYPQLLEKVIKKGGVQNFDTFTLPRPYWKNHPRLIELVRGKEVNVNNLVKALKKKCS